MMSLNNFEIRKTVGKNNTAEFEIGPLPTGYGHTIANILRRVLLSSIPGSAITAINVDGVQHEYSTLTGLKDDVLNVLLSLKNIVVVSKSDEPVSLSINVKGKDGEVVEVKASDIEVTSDVQVINKDYVITTLTNGKGKFKATLTVEKGVGYSLPQEDKRKELNTIPVDAKFSPVTLVSYSIVPTRVGHQTGLDQINMTITTNGAITSEEALSVASNILKEMFDHLVICSTNLLEGKPTVTDISKLKAKKEEDPIDQKQKLMVKDLNLSTRLTNALLRSGYEDLRDLEGMAEEEIVNIRGLGNKSIDELLKILKDNNIKVL